MSTSLDTNCKEYLSLAGSKKPRQTQNQSDNYLKIELYLEQPEVGR